MFLSFMVLSIYSCINIFRLVMAEAQSGRSHQETMVNLMMTVVHVVFVPVSTLTVLVLRR